MRAELSGHRRVQRAAIRRLRRDRRIAPAFLDRRRTIVAPEPGGLTGDRRIANAVLQRQLTVGAAKARRLADKRRIGETRRPILAASQSAALAHKGMIAITSLQDRRGVVAMRLRNNRAVPAPNLANEGFIATGVSYRAPSKNKSQRCQRFHNGYSVFSECGASDNRRPRRQINAFLTFEDKAFIKIWLKVFDLL
jgi:hypothetical protein